MVSEEARQSPGSSKTTFLIWQVEVSVAADPEADEMRRQTIGRAAYDDADHTLNERDSARSARWT